MQMKRKMAWSWQAESNFNIWWGEHPGTVHSRGEWWDQAKLWRQGRLREMFTIKFQFPVLFGLPMAVLSTEGGVWAGETMAAKEVGTLWQWMQCMQMAQWPRRRDSVALSLSAGPSFIPIVVVRWSSVRRGSDEPSMRCSRKFCNIQRVACQWTDLWLLTMTYKLLSVKGFKSRNTCMHTHTFIIYPDFTWKMIMEYWLIL